MTNKYHMSVRTRTGANAGGKCRVYFTCHPKDFERYFDKVCEDIFKTLDCAIYYTEDMTMPIPDEYIKTDIGQNNLFVVPVTFRLLTEPCRAMDVDFAYADKENMLILPLMMETEIDEFYKAKFGERQYLCPFSQDLTEISYEDKLKKFLSTTFVDKETAKRIRKAFDAYIFLSYRKKDRNHANELMGLIHKNPMYRDIAIWYDEFLAPGESFNQNIQEALEKSDLFTLLVTPNLVNEENYVQTTEYPNARDAKKQILPAEMVETNRRALEEQYPGIPACIDPHIGAELDNGILEALKDIALKPNEDDPKHNYLIGLAYLEGIDVEINHEYAVELITKAAEAEYPEAMAKLYHMYDEGQYVRIDNNKALKWAERLYNYCKHNFGEKDPKTLTALNNLAVTYDKLGNNQRALELKDKAYTLHCEVFGEKDPKTLTALNNLAYTYGNLGDYQKALELFQKVYELRREVLGKEHRATLKTLESMAYTYGKLGNRKKQLEIKEELKKHRGSW